MGVLEHKRDRCCSQVQIYMGMLAVLQTGEEELGSAKKLPITEPNTQDGLHFLNGVSIRRSLLCISAECAKGWKCGKAPIATSIFQI